MQLLESFTGIGPNQIKLPIIFDPKGTWPGTGTCGYIAITNGTAAVITISDLTGHAFFNVPTYQSYTLVVPNYTAVQLTNATGATIQPNDVLNVALYDQAGSLSFSSFGPAAWGSGPQPGVLTQINPGDQFLTWQVNQLIQYITGTGPASGPITTSGPTGAFVFDDQDGIGGDYFQWYANASQAHLYSSVFGADTVTIGEAGNWLFAKRVESNATGASGKPLLNFVPLNNPTGTVIVDTGAHGLTSFSIAADVPTSAVAVALTLTFSSTNTAQLAGVFNANPNTNAQLGISGTAGASGGVIGLPTPQTLWYTTVGAGAFTLSVYPTGYYEAS